MTTSLHRLGLIAGLLLAGEGLLVVTRVLDHEAPLAAGWAALAAGLALSLLCAPRSAAAVAVPASRRLAVAGLGAAAAGGVVSYNAARASDLSLPELAIVAYGAALLLASTRLHDRRVGALVAYSFPLVLAPLSLFALNAALAARAAQAPLAWYLRETLVAPMALLLHVFGLHAQVLGETVALATPRGALFLTVGMVCSGLYATVLFLGVFALFAWEQRTPPKRLAAYLAIGVAGLHAANVARLVLLAVVGVRWGGDALQAVHQHAGWVLFLAWALVFWWLVLRRWEGPARAA